MVEKYQNESDVIYIVFLLLVLFNKSQKLTIFHLASDSRITTSHALSISLIS
jgi:hypothetical protein